MKKLTCAEASGLISPHLDGYTDVGESNALDDHLQYCTACATEVAEYRKIAGSLLQMNMVSCPETLSSKIMSRLQQDFPSGDRPKQGKSLRHLTSTRFGTAKKALVAAVAAILIMAGSAGLNVGYKFVANNDGSIPTTPEQHYEVAANNGEKPGEAVVTPAVIEQDPAPGENPSIQRPTIPSSTDNRSTIGNAGTPAVTQDNNPPTVTDREPVVLLSNDITIESSIQKIKVSSAEEARRQAADLAGSYGGKAQVLSSQAHGNSLINILHITVSKDQAPQLMTSLSGLGTQLERNNEKLNITSQYRELAVKYNELIALKESGATENAATLDSQIAAAEKQLNNWAKDAGSYTILLWLEQ